LLRTGDTVQLAVDNTAAEYNAYLCLVPPVDEFGADDAQRDCENDPTRVDAGRLSRLSITYNGPTGQPFVVVGDNTPVADGSGAVLEWSRAKGTPGPEGFTPLAGASSVGGQVVFNAALPPEARDKIQLRACAAQPGGGPSCTRAATVAVAASAPLKSASCLKAERARRTLRKRVITLKRKVRAARRASAHRRYVRKLRVSRKRLKSARRTVAKRC